MTPNEARWLVSSDMGTVRADLWLHVSSTQKSSLNPVIHHVNIWAPLCLWCSAGKSCIRRCRNLNLCSFVTFSWQRVKQISNLDWRLLETFHVYSTISSRKWNWNSNQVDQSQLLWPASAWCHVRQQLWVLLRVLSDNSKGSTGSFHLFAQLSVPDSTFVCALWSYKQQTILLV